MAMPKDPIKAEQTRKLMSLQRKGKTWEDRVGKERAEEIKAKISKKTCGANNPRWKGGISEQWYRQLMKKNNKLISCSDCGTIKRIHTHHKNKNHKDNKIENLEYLCSKCHKKRHKFIRSEEWKRKLSERMKGNQYTKGMTWEQIFGKEKAKKMKEERSLRMKKFNENNKGKEPWNKGLTKQKIEELKYKRGD